LKARTLLVYVHFPWCLAKCPYCDFVSYKAERAAIPHRRYADAVLAEARARARIGPGLGWERAEQITSVFFGGGTPSLWAPEEIGRVLSGLRELFAFAGDAEITAECNPTSLDAARARALRDAGVNRVSIGTQSLRQRELELLGRLHDPQGALAAVRAALATPGLRVSTDMIFGLPDQDPDDARAQAEELAALPLEHLSAYQLTIEPNTRFGEMAKRGRLPRADDGAVADAFLRIDAALAARGLRHYEISNYAAPGQESRHNLGYWRGEEYLGLGCAAVGFRRDRARGVGVRAKNETDPAKYMQNASDPEALAAFREEVDGEAMLRERIMLGLRIREGLDIAASAADLGVDAWPSERRRAADRLIARGRLRQNGDVLTIPPREWLFADDTAARLF
jgi:oxygen-independent coproporphyrinogen-3 oxidase